MDREYVWGAECGDCGARILRSEVGLGCTLDEWLGAHKEMLCLAKATPHTTAWPDVRPSLGA